MRGFFLVWPVAQTTSPVGAGDGLAAMPVPRSAVKFCAAFRRIEFKPYAPVRDQRRFRLRAVNCRRLAAGLERLPRRALRRRRLPVGPFENPGGGEIAHD